MCFTGTGKSVTGAHLAYAFIVANRRLHPSSSNGKIKCVMYCGPSNKSIDVVLGMHCYSSHIMYLWLVITQCYTDMFLKHPNVKDLHILRIYSKSIETKYHYGPHSNKVWQQQCQLC